MTCNGYCRNFDGLNDDGSQFYCCGYHQWLNEGNENPDTCPKNPDNQ